jgi:hypothetical protein
MEACGTGWPDQPASVDQVRLLSDLALGVVDFVEKS